MAKKAKTDKARREPAPLARRMVVRMADARALLSRIQGTDEVQAVTALAVALMRAEGDGKIAAYEEALGHMRAAMSGSRKAIGDLVDPPDPDRDVIRDPGEVTAPVIDEAAVKAAEKADQPPAPDVNEIVG